jgi:hypothetical protein
MVNIMITNYHEGENVVVFSNTITIELLKERLQLTNDSYDDIFEIKDEDRQYYLYESLHKEINVKEWVKFNDHLKNQN